MRVGRLSQDPRDISEGSSRRERRRDGKRRSMQTPTQAEGIVRGIFRGGVDAPVADTGCSWSVLTLARPRSMRRRGGRGGSITAAPEPSSTNGPRFNQVSRRFPPPFRRKSQKSCFKPLLTRISCPNRFLDPLDQVLAFRRPLKSASEFRLPAGYRPVRSVSESFPRTSAHVRQITKGGTPAFRSLWPQERRRS
ncbi:hypothetical protein CA85_05830 [Allorhodopirellula solitaria]|uniref:Uncharacterized protein n=1 Tax=Allorhodopirellula solitaria TaxID=2527987 RepID=A0A5C5YK57_9BACT|nr:hypothetical protein CA85_05830 [Allorhodopirellula solitaria]